MGYPTYEVTRATLDNTTNLIHTLQAETREYIRDHYRTRVYTLKPRHIDDVLYSNTFFPLYAQLEDTNTSKCLHLSIQNLKELISFGGRRI